MMEQDEEDHVVPPSVMLQALSEIEVSFKEVFDEEVQLIHPKGPSNFLIGFSVFSFSGKTFTLLL